VQRLWSKFEQVLDQPIAKGKGQRQGPLPVGADGQYLVAEVGCRERRAFGDARRAKPPAPARIRHQTLEPTGFADKASEATLHEPSANESPHLVFDVLGIAATHRSLAILELPEC